MATSSLSNGCKNRICGLGACVKSTSLFLNQLLIIKPLVNALISGGEVIGHRDFADIDKRRIQGIIKYLLLILLSMESLKSDEIIMREFTR